MSKFYKEEKKVNESKFVAEHCEDLTFEMYISDIKASGCDVASMNELRDEFEAAGLQVTGEKGPEGVIMKVTANDPEQCESVYNILMGHGCDEAYVDFVMNNPAQHDGESFADVEEDVEEEIPFESVNNKKQKNAILESIKKGGCGCAPKKLNESMNDSLYYYELYNSEASAPEEIQQIKSLIQRASRDPRVKLFAHMFNDYAGSIDSVGLLVRPEDLEMVKRIYPQGQDMVDPEENYRYFSSGEVDPSSCIEDLDLYNYDDYVNGHYDEFIKLEDALEIIGSLYESAKPEVKSPFGSVKVNGKKLGECGKGELRQMLREAKQELKELKKEEKSLGEGCGKRAKNKIAKKIEKAEKLVEILEEEIKFNPKKAGAVNEAKSLWEEFTKWSKLYEAEEEEEDEKEDEKPAEELTSEKPEDSEEETEEKEDAKEEAELEAILLTVKNIEKVNQNLIDAGIPEEHIQMIPDEEDPKQGKIRVDADDAITLKEYLATLGIDLEEEIGAELVTDEESEEKEDDSEEGEEKKDDDKEVNDDDVEISADDIFGDM